jgi:hypothetical protein
MSETEQPRQGFSLRRWSERKRAAARHTADAPVNGQEALPPPPVPLPAPQSVLPPPVPANLAEQAAPMELPPVDTLTFESDFSAFLQPRVDPSLRVAALKRLFRDPRFNAMDGLDVYIEDFGKPDPIAPELVRQLVQGRYLFDPPPTRVNERGEVEDAPVVAGDAPPVQPDPAALLAPGELPNDAAAAAPDEPHTRSGADGVARR